MSENAPSNPQFVGQADARKSEVPVTDEFTLFPEQQQVVDVMEKAGAKLETLELDGREKAAGELKKLQGKELVDAGLKQMGHGVWQSVKSRFFWGVGGALVGAVSGGVYGSIVGQSDTDRDASLNRRVKEYADMKTVMTDEVRELYRRQGVTIDRIFKGMDLGAVAGSYVGFETSGVHYNKKIAVKNNLPPAKWYDWIIGNGVFGLTEIASNKSNGIASSVGLVLLQYVFNPITVGGMRNVATGLWQMKKG